MIRFGKSLLAAAICTTPLAAGAQPVSIADSFRIGSGSGVLCSAQFAQNDRAMKDMFDRAYAVTCRDASVPVGQLYVLKTRGEDPAARLAGLRADKAQCEGVSQEQIEGIGAVSVAACAASGSGVGYKAYSLERGGNLYVAEGLAGYDSALKLGLRTIVSDRPVDGEISIAQTEATDAAAFARVQAGTLSADQALAEAYRRNNSGNYAESAEFFGSVLDSASGEAQAEAQVNQALQQSNLGNYVEANDLFDRVEERAGGDAVMTRMLRNYRVMHLMNQGRATQAMALLDRPLPAAAALDEAPIRELTIDATTAARLNSETGVGRQLGAATSNPGLTPRERALILDAQGQYLRGTILRVQGKQAEAATVLAGSMADLAALRGGRVVSTAFLRAQALSELGAIAEEQKNNAEAERQYQAAVDLLGIYYPGSLRLQTGQAALAAFYQRSGQTAKATTLFRQIVDANADSGAASPALRKMLAPYFALLAEQSNDPAAVADMFKASQLLVRPGVAQTQAVLARELSGGSDEASRLFRQSVNLTRDIERARVEIARVSGLAQPTPAEQAQLIRRRTEVEALERDQTATQARLAEFPRYRVVSGGTMALPELQAVLREGEAYYKMMVVGDDAYAIFVSPASARAFKLAASPADLDTQVDGLRDTVAKVENGELVTYPFDVEGSAKLYAALFGPVSGEVASVRHLVFEPDGAMLRLPPNLLVSDRPGIDAYLAKAGRPNDDGFDFTDVNWLGKDRDISTAVSARSFRDVRQVSRSAAQRNYIGFGQNAVPSGMMQSQAATRSLLGESDACQWSIAEWTRPISPQELQTASRVLGGGAGTEVVTGEAFTDTAIKDRPDLSQYRIMHFATHGLVTAPRPECPARPALMTSFGSDDSDGLLTFAEIFDLKLDADLVILSACDTAGKATVAATREAGVTTGGDQALDGLVRAFVGAGGRSIIASHWPVPDDYNATERLITGLFEAPAGTATASALRTAQNALMREPATSHPYYWAGFAIVGDGATPVIPATAPTTAAVAPQTQGLAPGGH